MNRRGKSVSSGKLGRAVAEEEGEGKAAAAAVERGKSIKSSAALKP